MYDKDRDWYISSMKKSFILSALLVIKDMLIANPSKEPTRKEFDEKRRKLSELKGDFWEEFEDLPWEKVRQTSKAMWRKYKKDLDKDDLTKFNKYVSLARSYWKFHFTG